MIIATRYRDIPVEEIGHGLYTPWEKLRGRPVVIETPAKYDIENPPRFKHQPHCKTGPWFKVVDHKHFVFGGNAYCCPHTAEIGD